MFEPIGKLVLGLITGIFFGFFLQKGWVAKQKYVMGSFLLKEMRAVKILLTAAAVGSIGVYALFGMGIGELSVKPAQLGGVLLGGVLFGIGIVLFGYCPGTSVAASGEGWRDAWVGVLGMLAGAGAYVWSYPLMEPIIKGLPNWGKITGPDITSIPTWLWVTGFAAFVAVILSVGEWYKKKKTRRNQSRVSDHSRRVA